MVKVLTQHLKGKIFIFDNLFTSEELLCDLAEDNIFACGTTQKDHRGFSPALNTAKLKNRSVYSKCMCCMCVYVHVCVYGCVCQYVCVCMYILEEQ